MENQPHRPDFKPPELNDAQQERVENLGGLFRSQGEVPTKPARKLNEQIRIVEGVPYLYDTQTDTWISLGGPTMYSGRVNSDGSAGTPFPPGWSITHNSTGIYQITHNLNADYTLVCTLYTAGASRIAVLNIRAQGVNNFDIYIFEESVTPGSWVSRDIGFEFVLIES